METVRQNAKQELNISNFEEVAAELVQHWSCRIAADCPEESAVNRASILRWLVGHNLDKFNFLNPAQQQIIQQGMEYRYHILRQRYLGLQSEQAYHQLLRRLGSLGVLRHKILAWVAFEKQQLKVMDVLQAVLQELLHSDCYMQQQLKWIAQCTKDKQLRNALLLASLEEYCMQSLNHQPLLLDRALSYLQRTAS